MSVLPFPQHDAEPAKPTSSFVNVTPELAARWLERNTHNRNLRTADVNRYVRDMAHGSWRLDGSPIRFGIDGTLLDGQHRLTAITRANVTIPLLVVRGIDPQAQSVMDTGRRRTASDALAIVGHENSARLAAAAKLLILEQNGKLNDTTFEVTHEEILRCIDANPDLAESVDFASKISRRTDCPPVVVGYTHWRFSKISPTDATEFWTAAANKVGLQEGDPVIALTNRFAESRRNRERMTREMQLSIIFRAWNYRRKGKRLQFIRVSVKGVVTVPEPR